MNKSEWIEFFQSLFNKEVSKRLNVRANEKLVKPLLLIWNGTEMAKQMHKREKYKKTIYLSTCVDVLKDNNFIKLVTCNGFSYRMTGEGSQIEIIKK